MATGRKLNQRIVRCCAALLLGFSMLPALAGPAEEHAKALRMWEVGSFTDAMAALQKLATDGYAPSQVWLGELLDHSERNEAAVEWFQKAADQGDAAGEFGLAQMYAIGEGTKKDNERALMYYTRSAEQGHGDAILKLAVVYRNGGLGVEANPEKADFWEAKLKALSPKEEPKEEKKKKKRR